VNIIDKLINWFNGGEEYTPTKPSEAKKLDISQPIIEFVELMKKDIKRFDITYKYEIDGTLITDLKTNLTIEYRSVRFFKIDACYSRTGWVTDDEVTLINNTLIEITEKRRERLAKVREWQNKRKRNKWVNVYCNDLEDK